MNWWKWIESVWAKGTRGLKGAGMALLIATGRQVSPG
jgi:hypothetical protein